jgi:hypothetical protein
MFLESIDLNFSFNEYEPLGTLILCELFIVDQRFINKLTRKQPNQILQRTYFKYFINKKVLMTNFFPLTLRLEFLTVRFFENFNLR